MKVELLDLLDHVLEFMSQHLRVVCAWRQMHLRANTPVTALDDGEHPAPIWNRASMRTMTRRLSAEAIRSH